MNHPCPGRATLQKTNANVNNLRIHAHQVLPTWPAEYANDSHLIASLRTFADTLLLEWKGRLYHDTLEDCRAIAVTKTLDAFHRLAKNGAIGRSDMRSEARLRAMLRRIAYCEACREYKRHLRFERAIPHKEIRDHRNDTSLAVVEEDTFLKQSRMHLIRSGFSKEIVDAFLYERMALKPNEIARILKRSRSTLRKWKQRRRAALESCYEAFTSGEKDVSRVNRGEAEQ